MSPAFVFFKGIYIGFSLGPKFIKDIKGPIPNVELMPSGGVNLQNITDWIQQGSFAIGIGSDLTKSFTNCKATLLYPVCDIL